MGEAEMFSRLMTFGGYPESFIEGDDKQYKRWRQAHLDII